MGRVAIGLCCAWLFGVGLLAVGARGAFAQVETRRISATTSDGIISQVAAQTACVRLIVTADVRAIESPRGRRDAGGEVRVRRERVRRLVEEARRFGGACGSWGWVDAGGFGFEHEGMPASRQGVGAMALRELFAATLPTPPMVMLATATERAVGVAALGDAAAEAQVELLGVSRDDDGRDEAALSTTVRVGGFTVGVLAIAETAHAATVAALGEAEDDGTRERVAAGRDTTAATALRVEGLLRAQSVPIIGVSDRDAASIARALHASEEVRVVFAPASSQGRDAAAVQPLAGGAWLVLPPEDGAGFAYVEIQVPLVHGAGIGASAGASAGGGLRVERDDALTQAEAEAAVHRAVLRRLRREVAVLRGAGAHEAVIAPRERKMEVAEAGLLAVSAVRAGGAMMSPGVARWFVGTHVFETGADVGGARDVGDVGDAWDAASETGKSGKRGETGETNKTDHAALDGVMCSGDDFARVGAKNDLTQMAKKKTVAVKVTFDESLSRDEVVGLLKALGAKGAQFEKAKKGAKGDAAKGDAANGHVVRVSVTGEVLCRIARERHTVGVTMGR